MNCPSQLDTRNDRSWAAIHSAEMTASRRSTRIRRSDVRSKQHADAKRQPSHICLFDARSLALALCALRGRIIAVGASPSSPITHAVLIHRSLLVAQSTLLPALPARPPWKPCHSFVASCFPRPNRRATTMTAFQTRPCGCRRCRRISRATFHVSSFHIVTPTRSSFSRMETDATCECRSTHRVHFSSAVIVH